MGINDWTESDKQLFAIGSRAALDDLTRQAEEWRSSAALDTTSGDELVRQHNARMRELEEQHKAWLARFINGDEGADTNVVAGALGDAPAASPSTGHGPRQQPNPDPYTAELAEAARLRTMDMATYAQERQRLIRTSDGMFG